MQFQFITNEFLIGQRADNACFGDYVSRIEDQEEAPSRSGFNKLLVEVAINGLKQKVGSKLKLNDEVNYSLIDVKEVEATKNLFSKPIETVFEDDHIWVINKPPGITVWPPNRHTEVVFDRLKAKINCEEFEEPNRAGIVHRIDKETGGLLIMAKTPQAESLLKRDFQDRQVDKEYLAFCFGDIFQAEGEIDLPIARHNKNPMKRVVAEDGKEALTKYRVVNRFKGFSELTLDLITGRTHQIRVHLSTCGHPICGDKLYGSHILANKQLPSMMLLAKSIEFRHPITEEELSFSIDEPEYYKKGKDVLTSLIP